MTRTEIISRNLRILRNFTKQPIKKVAEVIGTDSELMSDIEMGTVVIDNEHLYKIASFYGISLEDILTEDFYEFKDNILLKVKVVDVTSNVIAAEKQPTPLLGNFLDKIKRIFTFGK